MPIHGSSVTVREDGTTRNRGGLIAEHYTITHVAVTLIVTCFEVGRPRLGVTVTVTLHVPAFTPRTEAPATRHTRAEDEEILTEMRAEEGMAILASDASDLWVREDPTFSFADPPKLGTETVRHGLTFPALSTTRT